MLQPWELTLAFTAGLVNGVFGLILFHNVCPDLEAATLVRKLVETSRATREFQHPPRHQVCRAVSGQPLASDEVIVHECLGHMLVGRRNKIHYIPVLYNFVGSN